MKRIVFVSVFVFTMIIAACVPRQNTGSVAEEARGDYFGQTPPGDTARLFAPGIISTGMNERDFAITPDGSEIFFCREVGNYRYTTIFHSRCTGDVWSIPEVFEYCTDPAYKYIEPHLSPDGNRLFFISTMPSDHSPSSREDIWVSEKVDGRWGKPHNAGMPLNSTSKEFFPSVTRDGTVYFTHLDTTVNEEFIYRCRYNGGVYQQPEKLGPNVNIGKARFNAFVAPDESYIIIPAWGMPDSYGATDYYISFRDSLDRWSQPLNMGPQVNSDNAFEWSAAVSTDGKYLFFMSARMGSITLDSLSRESLQQLHDSPQNGNSDIYWVSTSVIDELKTKARF